MRAAFVGTVPPYVPNSRAPSPLERAEELGVFVGVMEAFTAGVCAPPGLEGFRAQLCLCRKVGNEFCPAWHVPGCGGIHAWWSTRWTGLRRGSGGHRCCALKRSERRCRTSRCRANALKPRQRDGPCRRSTRRSDLWCSNNRHWGCRARRRGRQNRNPGNRFRWRRNCGCLRGIWGRPFGMSIHSRGLLGCKRWVIGSPSG